ncbi:hypothetical protein L7F22_009755 [Adiantum nelumboides]|nr:hypothetical protein [Adiantum nelumboides]
MDSLAATVARMPALRAAVAADPSSHRVLTGERPTGPLHLGHLVGTISERVRLQRSGVDVLVILADYQVITDRDVADRLSDHVRGAVLDQLAAGLDPDRTTVFAHSAVPALNQLMLPFLSLVTEAELHRNPTVKAEHAASGRAFSRTSSSPGCWPGASPSATPGVHPARADADRHPGAARARRAQDVQVPRQRRPARRDRGRDRGARAPRPHRPRAAHHRRPGRQAGVYGLLTTAALCLGRDPHELAATLDGAAALKRLTTDAVNDHLAGHRARRAELARDPGLVDDVLARGNARANALADETLDAVRTAMGMRYGRVSAGTRSAS